MGRRIQADRVVFRIAAAYFAVFVVVLAALGVAAFAFLARVDADALRPIMDTPEGAGAYRAALTRAAVAIGAALVPLALVVAAASYALAALTTRPLREGRARERQFTADAAHELRTPLARIASVAQAARGSEPQARDAALDAIARDALEASELVADLLTLARTEYVEPRAREPVDLGALARDAVTGAGPRDGVDISLRCTGTPFVDGDERALRRMVGNLIANAVRHARTHVDVTVAERDGRATLTVEDDGDGVPEELRARIFERFVSAAPGGRGTGLGLAICRWVARAHGGDVALDGAACFIADLPAIR